MHLIADETCVVIIRIILEVLEDVVDIFASSSSPLESLSFAHNGVQDLPRHAWSTEW